MASLRIPSLLAAGEMCVKNILKVVSRCAEEMTDFGADGDYDCD
jgi:hypothetical protein